MKYELSKYVRFLAYKDSLICMQMNKRLIFALEDVNSNLLLNNLNNINLIREVKPHLFSALIKLGVIKDANENEFDEIKNANFKEIFDKKLRLTIIPTLECNLSCWYCYETHIKGLISDETINSILIYIRRMINDFAIEEIELDWFGGEPLLHFYDVMVPTIEKVKYICQINNVRLSQVITTNGSLIDNEMVLKFNEIGLINFQITLDGKEEIHNKIRNDQLKTGTYKIIVDAVNMICENMKTANVLLRINYTSKSIGSINEIIEDFPIQNRNNIKVLFQQVWQLENKNKPLDLETYYNTFRKEGFQVEFNRFNNYNIACYADKYYQSVINFNGDVYKCTARDFADRSLRAGYLNKDGIIIWDSESHKKRFRASTIENKFCRNCEYVPLCYGPCSQKQLELEKMDSESFKRICYKKGLETSVERAMIEFYETTFK
ncbi:MAG: radical SAM protein [Peptostreptococcales bacterium]